MEFFEWDYLGLVRALKTGYAEFEAIGRKVAGGEFPRCTSCQAKIGTLQWQPPFLVRLTTNKYGDLCTDGIDILLSHRFREACRAAKITGVQFAPEEVCVRAKAKPETDYQLLRIQHVITRLDEEASGLVVSKLVGCQLCRVAARERVERIRVDESSWTGLDVFCPSGLYGAVLVTARFVEMVSKYSLTNFHFIHQDDYREPKKWTDEH